MQVSVVGVEQMVDEGLKLRMCFGKIILKANFDSLFVPEQKI